MNSQVAALVREQGNDPSDPICIGCGKRPEELADYSDIAADEGVTSTQYVIREEGTYNRENGHFTCDGCYIAMGMPTSPRGWVAP